MMKGGVQIEKAENGYVVHLIRPQGFYRGGSGSGGGLGVGSAGGDEFFVFMALPAAIGFAQRFLQDPMVAMRESDRAE